jgi:coenzyme PQQ precursor peptide PqqA
MMNIQILFALWERPFGDRTEIKEMNMIWITPTLVEICIGLEINGYLPNFDRA